jgi:predicted dehydrogenase
MGSSLARALAATGEARPSIVYDVQPEAASRMADSYQGRVASSAEELLAHPGLAGVIVALPPYLHAQAVVQAAAAGVNVFCEKPLAPNVADCQQILNAVERGGVKLMVGQVLRYYEPYRSILRWQSEGRFGRMFAASIWRITDGRRMIANAAWRGNHAESGGYLLEIGAHELDMLRCLMGTPQAVHCQSEKALSATQELADYIAVQVRFTEGGSGAYEGGAGASTSRYGFRFFCEGATLVSDKAFDRRALQVHTRDDGPLEALENEFSTEHPVETELRLWLSALRDEAPIAIPGQEGLATVALAEAAYRSAETCQIVTLDT